MSLLLDLLRQLLEYLGIPVDQLDQIWENCTNSLGIRRILESPLLPFLIQRIGLEGWKHKEYGNTRSIVRLIGTFLPLDPSPRTHFQSVPSGRVREPKQYTTLCRLDIPSLADIPWVLDNEVLPNATFRHDIFERNHINLERSCIKTPGLVQTIQNSTKSHLGSNSPTAHASQKIAALENELIQLRAQIAAIVALQDTKSIQSCSETLCSFGSPMNALPPPSFTSTPIPPPPPPPPPSFPSAKPDPGKSAIDLIKRRKEAHKQHMGEMVAVVKDSMNKHPSMMDVLKGINTIKLRAVERSPGGTPLTRKDKRRSLNDPASIIALALKKKFAHRHTDDSFDKENRSQEDYAFSSPETPQFGRHLLKPVERRTQKRQILISSVANN